jgi:hypothetical protein
LEKEKFEEDTPLNDTEKEYQNKYNKIFGDDQKIKNITHH